MEKITECKACKSTNIKLKPEVEGENILSANKAEIVCGDCREVLGICPKKDRKLYLTEEELDKALTEIEEEFKEEAPIDTEIPSTPENDPPAEEPNTEAAPVEEDAEKEVEGALIDKDEFKAPENANEIEQPSGEPTIPEPSFNILEPSFNNGPSIKDKAIEIVLAQKKIIMGSFVLEREKALAVITNIVKELNNL